ncbi:MAG TPA: GspE/PulE family protein [Candidatus Paceibacterota bacterium]|nr:GspE/PulE family protein [Candidatus Paceibacterota bacterium]
MAAPATTPPASGAASQLSSVPVRTLPDGKIPYDVLRYIPEESAEHYKLAPIAVEEGVLAVGMVDPDNIAAIDALNFITRKTGMPFKIYRISDEDFARIIEMYKGIGGEVDRALTDLESEKAEKEGKGKAQAQEEGDMEYLLDLGAMTDQKDNQYIQEDAPAIKIVSTILRYAIDGRASDIHVEPTPQGVRVRYRVDGDLHTSVVLPLNTHRAVVARIKVLSAIRLDEKRRPQDGRFSAKFDDRQIDFRVSTFPSNYGEKVVIRILDREQGFIPIDKLGLSERDISLIRRAIQRPHGLILISGPTGSGKSTTLYSMLAELDREHKNVLSLEDPIEYYIDGIIQSQVRPEIGYTFATGLRTTLRQDPDIIMVGEIRDGETAKLAVQAALTGHLVLSTIHTNDAVGVVPRLIDMGVEPYLIPPVLVLSMAQRLVRTLCAGTGKEVPLSASDIKRIEAELETLPKEYRFKIQKTAYEPERTETCPTGLRGRMAVFEVMEMTPEIEKIILTSPVESKIREAARLQGMTTMREDAIMKAFAKQIPFSEVNTLASVLSEDEDEEKETPQEPPTPAPEAEPEEGDEKEAEEKKAKQ